MMVEQGKVIKRTLTLLALCGLMMSIMLAKAANQPLYDPQANAQRDIAAAIAKASKAGRNIVLIFGANW